jgi:hypothetical protein
MSAFDRTTRIAALLLMACAAALPVMAAEADNPADAVVQRFIDASGGAARLGALHSRLMESTMKVGWFKVAVKTTQLWPDRVLIEATLPIIGKNVSSGYDGAVAWAAGDDGSPRRLQGREMQELVLGQRLDRIGRLLELYPVRRLLPPAAGAASTAQQVEMNTAFGTQEIWTFDPATGLLQSTDGLHDAGPKKPLARLVTHFEDYRKVDGLTLPFRALLDDGKSKCTITMTRLINDPPLDATIISAPPDLKP